MKRSLTVLLATLIFAGLPLSASAEATPFQFSFFDLDAPSGDEVKGVKLTVLYGDSGPVTGWDVPLFAISRSASMQGFSWTPFFIGGSVIDGDMTGVTWSIFTKQGGQATGANLNFVNLTNNVKGANVGMVNFSTGYTVADVSWVNVSEKSNFQLGLVNITDEIDGVQIGLLSCAKNGFLPCFVLFNFGGM